MALSRSTKLSQISLISAITGTRMRILNNNPKIGPRVEHKADSLRRSILTKKRLGRNIVNTQHITN